MTEFGWIIPIVKMYSGILQILMLYSFYTHTQSFRISIYSLAPHSPHPRMSGSPLPPDKRPRHPVRWSRAPSPCPTRCPMSARCPCCPSQCRWCPMSARCPMFTRCRDGRCPQGVRVVRCPHDVPRDVRAVRAAAARDWAPRRGMGRAGAEAAPSLGHLPHTALN